MKLYYSPAACSLAVHIAAREAGIRFDLVKVDLLKHRLETGEPLTSVNRKNVVPVLELDSGERLTEAAVILQWLADKAGDRDLLPAPGSLERVRVQEWLNFVATELHKSFSPWLWHPETEEGTKKTVRERLAARFAILDEELSGRDYLTGDRFTVADAYAFTIVNWSNLLNVDLKPYANLRAYMDRVAARPAVRQAMSAEGLLKEAA
ncbi:glutathione transferase GstA [Microvirga thermotolerans]|uniref:Glutathione transferase GstA n=1 Tax=Microvirga thermotolerans TaxID=2651334 RepID=A0A5P9JU57_9HYPH|nr:glutathione transferase GstA [Microvirga thermotolerans]QFU15963.1 glutathione transferase GstA [Microvirga thermotolerans]